jgi:uncharacterized protein
MILYLDASALVKKYVTEPGTATVNAAISATNMIGTSLLTRAEVAAALAKAVRMGWITAGDGMNAAERFRTEWPHLFRIVTTEALVAHADELAWMYGLRGYDAMHLASGLFWQRSMRDIVTFATFDRLLWTAAQAAGLTPFPADLSSYLASNQRRA